MNAAAPLRLAFTHIPRRLWAGGYNYQSNLFAALSKFRPGEFTPVLFAGTGDDDADLAPLAAIPGVEVVRSPAFEGRRRFGCGACAGAGPGGGDRIPNAAHRCLSLKPPVFSAGVCLIRRWPGFPIFSIDGCLSFSRSQRDGVARPVSEFKSHPGGPSC